MSTTAVNQRRSHRYSVREMGYTASLVIGADRLECLVTDFSAAGISIETSLENEIPQEGRLIFREQAYRYVVRNIGSDEEFKRLGLQTFPLNSLESSDLVPADDQLGRREKSGRGVFGLNSYAGALWAVATVSVCVVWALLSSGVTKGERAGNESFWEQLAGSTKCSPADGVWANLNAFLQPKEKSAYGTKVNQPTSITKSLASSAISRATELIKSADFEAAIRVCDQVISNNNRLAVAWRLRGVAYNKLAQNDQAVSDLRRALSLDAKDPLIHIALAKTFCDRGEFDEGVGEILSGFDLAAEDQKPKYKQLVGKVYEARSAARHKSGDRPGAQSDLAEAKRWIQ